MVAAHRLILSGTPVQNSIGELWGLFDWLMPGFLGSEKAFQVHGCLAGADPIKLTMCLS